jgi:hypothetical protein
VAPLAVLRRVPRWLGMLLAGAVTLATLEALYLRAPGAPTPTALQKFVFHLQAGLVLLFAGSLLVGVRSSAAITGERERNTWEALLLAPLLTYQVVEQKFRGIRRAAVPYLLAYAGPALALALWHGIQDAAAAGPARAGLRGVLYALTDVLLAALWVGGAYTMMSWVASHGLACSARARGSWVSLLATLGLSYLVGLALCVAPCAFAGFVLTYPQEFREFSTGELGRDLGSGLICFGVPAAVLAALPFWLLRVVVRHNLEAAEGAILQAERTWTLPEGILLNPPGQGGLRSGTG